MSFFYLMPVFWFAGVLLYAASPRQQISNTGSAIVSKTLAWSVTAASAVTTQLLIHQSTGQSVAASIIVITLLMLFIPAPVIWLSHRPKQFKASSAVVTGLCLLFHLLSMRG